MIKSMLIPTDGSPNSLVAADYACWLAHRFDARLHGLHVIDIRALEGPFIHDISGSLGFSPFQNWVTEYRRVLEQRADTILEQLQAHCARQSMDVEVRCETGIVAGIISDEARKVDLLVIAQHGEHHQWSSGLLGSTAESVVRKSPRPVLLCPTTFYQVRHLLVAYDGSVPASHALQTACALFDPADVSVETVIAADDDAAYTRLSDEVRTYVASHDVEMRITRLDGDAGPALLAHTTQAENTLLVMGAFGHSRLRDLLVGGTTAYIMRRATVPLLLCH